MKKRGITPQQAIEKLAERGNTPTSLRTMRVRRGLSQSELAEASGISRKTIQKFEQECSKIDNTKLSTLCSLSEALNCRISDILDDKRLVERFNSVK